jgi:hypothetical protein
MTDHFTVGWAALALRYPDIRPYRTKAHGVRDLCEAYGEAVAFRDSLRRFGDPSGILEEYEIFCRELEKDILSHLSSMLP